MTFIADADDKKVRELYMLFQEEIKREPEFKLTHEHLKGKSKSYSWNGGN
jgi:hypothetical protein